MYLKPNLQFLCYTTLFSDLPIPVSGSTTLLFIYLFIYLLLHLQHMAFLGQGLNPSHGGAPSWSSSNTGSSSQCATRKLGSTILLNLKTSAFLDALHWLYFRFKFLTFSLMPFLSLSLHIQSITKSYSYFAI